MKILFIFPSSSDSIFNIFDSHRKLSYFSTNILSVRKPMMFSILAALTPAEHSVELIKGDYHDIDFSQPYDIVAITCTTSQAQMVYQIADEFRRRECTVVLGGYHPSSLPEEAKQHADSVVIDEAEETWPALLKDYQNGTLRPFYIQTRPTTLETLPLQKSGFNPIGAGVGIQATRGCPNRCDFCSISHTKFAKVFRTRPIPEIIKEIESQKEKVFIFQDNSLTIDPGFTKKLFIEMKYLNKKFFAYGNINVLGKNDDLLTIARDAGCIGWNIGFESVNQSTLNSVGKPSNQVSNFLSSIKKIHDHNMIVEGSFIFGFDQEISDIFEQTNEFVRKSEIEAPFALLLVPYPGTKIYEKLFQEERILTKDWSKYDGEHVVFRPLYISPDQLLQNIQNLNQSWHKTFSSLRRVIRSIHGGFYAFSEITAIELYWRLQLGKRMKP